MVAKRLTPRQRLPEGSKELALFVAWPAEDRAARALRLALDHALAALPGIAGRRLVSVLIDAAAAPPAHAVQALLADAARRLELAADVEASLAIDPRTIAPPSLADYRAAGINRLSLRAGSLDETAQAALTTAAGLFPKCAFDLTFGRPRQSLASWRAELDRAVQLGACHISLEEHSVAADGLSSDRAAAFYQVAVDRLRAAGLPPYEIAHFARPGHEARQLLHAATGGDYLGVGPGAVGRVTVAGVRHALAQVEPATAWVRTVETGAEALRQELRADERRTELLLSGLRLRAGIGRTWFEPLAGPLEAALDAGRLAPLIEDGFLELDRRGLRLTERGWPLCDGVLARLLH
jgi:coproporphyrinogen III oxidase-like Fe-S oxidoreductase